MYSGQHDSILYLILVALEHSEEGVDAYLFLLGACAFFGVAVPEHVLLSACQLVVGGEDVEIFVGDAAQEFLAPEPHLLAPPAYDGSVVDALARVGHHELLVDAHHAAEALAAGAGADGVVEGEEVFVGLGKGHAVFLEACAETVEYLGRVEAQETFAVALVKRRLDGVGQACEGVLVVVDAEAVDEQVGGGRFGQAVEHVFYAHHLAVYI